MIDEEDDQDGDEYSHEPESLVSETAANQSLTEAPGRLPAGGGPPSLIGLDLFSKILSPSDYQKVAKIYAEVGDEADRIQAREWQSYWNSDYAKLDIKVAQIEVEQGRVEQVELFLTKFFDTFHRPACYLEREPYIIEHYWFIQLFHEDEEKARLIWQNKFSQDFMTQLNAELDFVYDVSRIGYVEVMNLPNVLIIFYLLSGQERHTQYVLKLAKDIENKLREMNFKVVKRKEDAAATEKARPGRPSDKDYDWAYEQIYFHKRPRHQVYCEWLERIGNEAKTLDNPKDSFNSALKTRKRAREKKEKKD